MKFCKNCKFVLTFYRGTPQCGHPSNFETEKIARPFDMVEYSYLKKDINTLNSGNNCPNYKRIWWKVWVKNVN